MQLKTADNRTIEIELRRDQDDGSVELRANGVLIGWINTSGRFLVKNFDLIKIGTIPGVKAAAMKGYQTSVEVG